MIIWGIVLASALSFSDTPAEAIESTWAAVQDGSPNAFLQSLEPATADSILEECREYLGVMRGMGTDELGELFASIRLEAAPGELEHWNENAVLEMAMSSPSQHRMLDSSTMNIDSIAAGESSATARVTLNLQGHGTTGLELSLSSTPLGWRVGGIAHLTEAVLNSIIESAQ